MEIAFAMRTSSHRGHIGSIELVFGEPIRGKILGISDLITYESNSFDIREIQKQFNLSVDDYLETCEEVGKVAETPSSIGL